MNYKGETYLKFDISFQERLNEIADQLADQLITPGKHIVYNEHPKLGVKEFNNFWNEIPVNNPDGNKYSKNDWKGVYAFGEYTNNNLNVLYIGISQTIRRRYFKHTKEKNREAATWAYTILRHQNRDLPKEEVIRMIPNIQNSLIKNCRFTFIKEDDNMLMHLAEVYCANKLKAYWNSFETH